LARETRTINSVTVGGGIEVVRRVLHGPVTPACPASLLRLHPDAVLTVADYVAQPPDMRLR
jgi:hypothetical protein